MTPALRILLVDDEEIVRETLCDFMLACGHTVTQASDGREAVASLTKDDFDLILADVRMPGLDGMGLLENVRQEGSDIPVIMMTGHGDAEMETQAAHLGATGILVKPIRLRELDDLVQNLTR